MALKFANNNSLSAITTKPSGLSGGSLNLISTQTASSSSTISFTSGIDSTYDEYVFKFYDIHPATDNTQFSFQVDTGTNTNYNQTITSTFFDAYHDESDSDNAVGYRTALDQAQGTAFQNLTGFSGNGNDECSSGTLHIFEPSSSVFVKHFIYDGNTHKSNNQSMRALVAGYFNTTSAINAINFQFSSGNIDAGKIKLYGIKDS